MGYSDIMPKAATVVTSFAVLLRGAARLQSRNIPLCRFMLRYERTMTCIWNTHSWHYTWYHATPHWYAACFELLIGGAFACRPCHLSKCSACSASSQFIRNFICWTASCLLFEIIPQLCTQWILSCHSHLVRIVWTGALYSPVCATMRWTANCAAPGTSINLGITQHDFSTGWPFQSG